MVGILIIAHGTLGESLIHSASHVMGGRPAQLMQIGVGMHDDPQVVLPQAIKLLRVLDEGSGVLILSAEKGSLVAIEIDGPDEDQAMAALVGLINDKFGEGE